MARAPWAEHILRLQHCRTSDGPLYASSGLYASGRFKVSLQHPEWLLLADLTHWTLDPGNVTPTAGLERDVGLQAAIMHSEPL
jgi:hypothetical protein